MEQTYEHCSVDQIVQMAGQKLKVAGRQQEVHLKLEVLQEGDVPQREGVHRMAGDHQLEGQKWTLVEG